MRKFEPFYRIDRQPCLVLDCAWQHIDYVSHRRQRSAKSPMISGVFRIFRCEKPKRSTPRRQEKRKHMSAFYREKVLSVRHWTDTLFSFTATRDSGFRFQNGQF